MLRTVYTRLRKRWVMTRALLANQPHIHACTCGESWLCTKTGCDPVAGLDDCMACEGKQMDRWLVEFHARTREQGRVA